MKKLMIFLLFLCLFGCSEDATTTLGSRDFSRMARSMVYNATNLVDNGQALLDASMGSFTSITNEEERALVRALADYTLFPIGFGKIDDFDRRLRYVLSDTNWSGNLNSLMDDFITFGHTNFQNMSIENFLDAYHRKITAKSLKEDAIKKVKDVLISRSVNQILGWAPIAAVLDIFGLSSQNGSFTDELRSRLDQIETKIDQLQQTTAQILQEVSLLSSSIPTYVNYHAVLGIKNRYKGALQSYYQAGTQTIGMLSVSNYFLMGDFNSDLLNFITYAKEYYTLSATTNTNTYVADAGYCSKNKGRCYMYVGSEYFGTLKFLMQGFLNPKKHLLVSYGDLETIGRMMLTRLRFNALFFTGSTLKMNNRLLAQTYIQQLQEFKAAANDLYAASADVQHKWVCSLTNPVYPAILNGNPFIPGWISKYGSLSQQTYYTFTTYEKNIRLIKYGSSSDISLVNFIHYNGSLGAIQFPSSSIVLSSSELLGQPPTTGIVVDESENVLVRKAIRLKAKDEKFRAHMEYLNPYIARLVAIETLIRSYL